MLEKYGDIRCTHCAGNNVQFITQSQQIEKELLDDDTAFGKVASVVVNESTYCCDDCQKQFVKFNRD